VLDGDADVVADMPIYAEWLAAYFALGGDAVMALTDGALRLVRDRQDAVYDLARGGDVLLETAPEAQRLRDTLDRLIADAPIGEPAPVDPHEERAFAALGYLPGARLAASSPSPLSRTDQEAALAALRASARLLGAGDPAGSLARLERAARAYPRLAVIPYEMGSMLARAGRLQEAVVALNGAARLEPDHPALPMMLASLRLRLRDYDGAQASAQEAVALAELRDAPSLAAAHEIAARVALARADAESAVKHAEAAQEADDTLPLQAFVEGRVHYGEARYEDALDAFVRAEAAADDRGRPLEELHLYLGDTLSRLERYEEAESHYRREIEAFPSSTPAYAGLAMLYRASNREDMAEQVIADLMEAAPTPEGYASAARLWTVFGDQTRADALRADARRRFRGNPLLTLLEREP
jgi:tetratricopeptide (TPR) repeat protein